MKKDINNQTTKFILKLLFPLLICGIVQEIYELLNSIITGKGLGNSALAIIGGVTVTIISTYNNFSNGLRTAGMTIISKKYGANDNDIGATIKKTLVLCISFSLLFSIVFNLFGYQILELLNEPADIISDCYRYIRIYSIGFIPNTISIMIISAYRAIGEGKRPTVLLCFLYGFNLLTDAITVLWLKLDIQFLALSYVLSQSFIALILFYVMNSQYHLFADNHQEPSLYKKLLSIGLPIGLCNSSYALTTMIAASAVNNLGTIVVSSYTIYGKIENVYWLIMSAFSVALTTFYSMNLGAKKYKEYQQSILPMFLVSVLISALFGLCFYISSYYIPQFFTNNTETILITGKVIRFMSPFFIVYGPIELFLAIKNSFGKTLVPTILTFISIVGIRICWFLFIPDLNTIYKIFLVFPISWLASTVLFAIYSYFLLKNEFHNIKKEID